ncbi:unnamed protein product [Orchesella dallaii]|uniref:Uncharacterized protein n=1 Tax=Orchesella dallaii TaxID=48710 RepID=A0ABP1R6U7_9HEXA
MFASHLTLRLSSHMSAFPVIRMQSWFQSTSGDGINRFTGSSQVLRQRVLCILISCLLLTREITGEPHAHNSYTAKELAHNHQPIGIVGVGGEGGSDMPNLMQHATQDPFLGNPSFQHGNQSNNSKENTEHTASVIASSFRNIDSQNPNSNKEIEPTTPNQSVKKKHRCETTKMIRCLNTLPPMNDTGIPSTPEAVDRACRIYDDGMSCVDSWAKKCLPEREWAKLRHSIMGAHEMYSFLCKDPKFRIDFLKHKGCYKKLSPHWDDCSRHFIEGMRRNLRNNYTAFCCIRLEFLTCVSKASSLLCTFEATKFVMKMAETLIRTSTKMHAPDHCVNIQSKNCIPIHIYSNATPSFSRFSGLFCVNIFIPFFYFLTITYFSAFMFPEFVRQSLPI